MDALEAAKIAQAALDDKLGQDIQVLNLKGPMWQTALSLQVVKMSTICVQWQTKWNRNCSRLV